MKVPTFKEEIIIERCENKKALAVYTSTERAAKRISEEKIMYSDDRFSIGDRKTMVPDHIVMVVNPCFDMDEVEEFLKRPFE